MQTSENVSKRVKEERVAADLAAYASMAGDKLSRWEACKSTHRFMAYKGKQITVYRLNGATPEILDTLTSIAVMASVEDGLESVWKNSANNLIFINHKPLEVAPGCFLWHPKNANLELADWRGAKSLRFSTMWRTAHNPTRKVPGQVYLIETVAFARNFE